MVGWTCYVVVFLFIPMMEKDIFLYGDNGINNYKTRNYALGSKVFQSQIEEALK